MTQKYCSADKNTTPTHQVFFDCLAKSKPYMIRRKSYVTEVSIDEN